ncbi:MAG: glycosyltransferase family 2 protein [Acidobacteriota bacterium]|nr:glycosyltransferase family 2 protein [Acidobacteriota bacterium]
MLDRITPIILTFNESPNIARTLEKLAWAREVIIVDSGSTDDTVEIVRSFPNTRIVEHAFESFAAQWTFAIREAGVKTEWSMALDADYVLTDEIIDELSKLDPGPDVGGYRASFVYCVFGKRLRGSIYPPVTVLYRPGSASYREDGHTMRISFPGETLELREKILHDDRKPLSIWLRAQQRYMTLESKIVRETPWKNLNWPDRLRKMRVVAPFVVLVYCLFFKGAILAGKAGFFYAFQRTTAELILSLHLLFHDLYPEGAGEDRRE